MARVPRNGGRGRNHGSGRGRGLRAGFLEIGQEPPAPGASLAHNDLPSRASRYSRYEPDRRSRSPRDRSPDRFDRNSQYGDGDRRRSSAESRPNAPGFQSRDSFGREPPRGPKALVDAPSGPRGGGFAGDFRGGRGRGRGRAWPARDESRDRGRERDMDYRDRYRDERSRERDRDRDRDRERDRDRDRDRDWRETRDFRSRRSPLGRARSPARDFRDRDRDGPPIADADRSRRGSRDGGPPSAGSTSSDPQFGLPPFGRGGSFMRGRGGRGGRGDWSSDRGRGRTPYDDRGDRYPRSRSQEGRWGRDRDERDRGDRYPPEPDVRRDPRDERERGERDLIRPKKEARPSISQEPSQIRDVSPPPVAPSAPAFGSVPSRSASGSDAPAASGTGKPPPTAPRAYSERPVSAGHDSAPPTGPSRKSVHDAPQIPVGPRAQQPHPGSKQWVNPNLKKGPESPKIMRAQTFSQSGPATLRRGSSQIDQTEQSRPRSSDAKSDTRPSEFEDRSRSHYSAEPGEIVKFEPESRDQSDYKDRSAKSASAGNSPALQTLSKFPNRKVAEPERPSKQAVEAPKRRRRMPTVPVVRFAVPAKKPPIQEHDSESDDDDMADYFDMEIQKTEAELSKLPKPSLPRGVVARYAAMSHGAMAELLSKSEGLTEMLGPIPEEVKIAEAKPIEQVPAKPKVYDEITAPVSKEEEPTTSDTLAKIPEPTEVPESQPTTDAMDVDVPSADAAPAAPQVPSAEPRAEEEAKRGSVGPTAPANDVGAISGEASRQSVPSETTGVGSKPPSTPSQIPDEDDDETESEDEAFVDVETVRRYMRTPPIDSLPNYFTGQDWSKDEDFLATLDSDPVIDNFVAKHLDKIHIQEREEQTKAQKAYEDNYVQYLNFTLSSDPVAVKSRDKFSVAAPVPEVPGTATPEPVAKPEGRGARRFASERDLERVLQASMREDEERKERELRAQKEKYRSDKEAVIPDMYWDAEQRAKAQYTDRSGYTPVERLVSAWQVLPPVNNFTPEEAELFEKAYLEFPKQWGRIADAVPNRDFHACIQYYYLMKKELNLKEKLKKQPRRRKKGRGKQRSSALVSELGNGEQDGEETQDTGDNGERRRPRRAAAPTWGFEQPATDSENATPAGTPGRRGASAAARAEQGDKVDGRKGRRKAAKDKDAKGAKANQNLAAAATPSSARGRSRSSSRVPPNLPPTAETPAPAPAPAEPNRAPVAFEQPPAHAGIQPPFPVQQQQPVQAVERPKPVAASSISEVMAAPSLRPEPPPPPQQTSMTSFHLAQPQSERKTTTQASSYWSVSEANDFPHLLRAFGSDWTSIAAHMGSKTAVMVKNYFVRQKDQGKPEWEALVQEADAKRSRGEKRPDPPQPTAGGRGRRFENTTAAPGTSRPLAVAPGVDGQGEPSQAKMDVQPQQARPQGFSGYGVPIAQAPAQQAIAQPGPQPGPQPGQQPIAMQQHAAAAPPPATQAMSPGARPLRAPLQPFGFPERDHEPAPPAQQQQQQQRAQLPQKAGSSAVPELREQRPLAAAQPLQSTRQEAMMERQKLEMQQRERERERERELQRQSERQAMRMTQEAELAAQRHYEPYGHRQQSSLGGGPREPLSLARPPSQEPSRSVAGQPYPPPMQQQGVHAARGMMGELGAAQSPPLGPNTGRPASSLQQRQPPGPGSEQYGVAPPAAPPSRPPEPRKTSNIMSLLNDDPPPAAKRVSDVASTPGHSATPPPQGMGRPPPGSAPPSQMRREPEPQYSPYGRTPSGGPSMPPLKPTYGGSPNAPPPMGSAPSEREYYRQHAYQPQPGHHSSGTNSPQTSQRYPPPGQPGQGQYPPQSGYPTAYGGGGQVPHAASPPPPQYAVHQPVPRGREMPQGGRENAWPQQGHQQQPPAMQQATGWPTQPPKSQAPPPQQSWPQHPSSTPKPSTPAPAWSTAPPPQQPHPMAMRDERGASMYGANSQPPQHRYGPPASRGPEQVPPPAQAYPRYVSTPGPVGPRDPREQGRSYTPGVYDARGPPPPAPGQAYPGPDPREMSLRDNRDPRDPRDPREMMARGLRPHEYERHPDNRYGR